MARHTQRSWWPGGRRSSLIQMRSMTIASPKIHAHSSRAGDGNRATRPGFMQWWTQIAPRERITLTALIAGSLVAIINSTVWAIAVSYISRQNTLAKISNDPTQEEAAEAAEAAAIMAEEMAVLNGERSA